MSYTMMLTTTVEGANTKKRMRRRNMRQFIPLYFMMVPGLVYLLINNYLPLFGLTIAFFILLILPPIIIFVFLLLTRFFSHFHFFIEIASKSMSFPLAMNHGYTDV